MGLFQLSTLPPLRWPRYLALTVLPPVALVVGASVYLDSRLYGATTLVPLNFLRFNVLEGKSRIFGEQAWHWNFSQGLPAVLGAALPAALWGFWRPAAGGGDRHGGDRRLGWLAVWFLGEKRLGGKFAVWPLEFVFVWNRGETNNRRLVIGCWRALWKPTRALYLLTIPKYYGHSRR